MNRSDNFNRSDRFLNGDTPSDGGSAWVAGTSTQIQSNAVDNTDYAVLQSSVSDVDIIATLVNGAFFGNASLIARSSDSSNYWYAQFSPNNTWSIHKVVAGSDTQVASASASGTGNGIGYTVRFHAKADQLQIYYSNGGSETLAVDTGTGQTFNQSATKHGIGGPSTYYNSTWDNFSIVDLTALVAGSLSSTAYSGTSASFTCAGISGGVAPYSSQLYRSVHAANSYSAIGSPVSGSSPTFTDSGIIATQAYDWKVVTTDSASATVTSNVVTLSQSPINLTATASSTSVTLNWTQSFNSPTQNKIYRGTSSGSETLIGTISATTTYSDTGLTPGTTYSYKISSVSGAEGPLSQEASVLVGPPLTPSGLLAKAIDYSRIGLVWQLNSNDDTSLLIERSTDSGATWKTLITLGACEYLYVDSSCYDGTTYTYRITASNSYGSSSPSSTASATTNSLAGGLVANGGGPAPTGLTAIATSATTVNLTWNYSPNGDYVVERADNNGILYVPVLAPINGTPVTDVGLAPNTIYHYRIRAGSGPQSIPTPYCAAVSVTTPARAAGLPIEPSNLSLSEAATQVVVTWTENDSSHPQYEVWRADFSAFNFSLVATTTAGATTYTDTGLSPEHSYAYRVRAKNGTGFSDYALASDPVFKPVYGAVAIVCTASPGGGGRTLEIGPGKTYTTIAASPLGQGTLQPGDTVKIYCNSSTLGVVDYAEAVLLLNRGTPSSPITILGIADGGTGKLPIISAASAVATATLNGRSALWGAGVFVIGRGGAQSSGYKPGHIIVKNLEMQDCYTGNSYTTSGGSFSWGNTSAGIYINVGNDITIQNCIVQNNGNGIFAATQNTFDRHVTDLLISSNSIFGNSGTATPLSHNSYIEAVRVTYEYNSYGVTRTSSIGIGLKDRSSFAVLRYNKIQGGSHQIQLSDADNHHALARCLSDYTPVYGNEVFTPPGNASTPIWVGGDLNDPTTERYGFYVYHNTFVVRSDSTAVAKIDLFTEATMGTPGDLRNNVLVCIPDTQNGTGPSFGLLESRYSSNSTDAIAAFGENWVSPGYALTTASPGTFTGITTGTGYLVGSTVDPGFVNLYGHDYHPAVGFHGSGLASRLPARIVANYPVTKQYSDPQSSIIRANSTDLGAYQAITGSLAISPSTVEKGNAASITITGTGTSFGGAAFAVKDANGNAVSLTTNSSSSATAGSIGLTPLTTGIYTVTDTIDGCSAVLIVQDTTPPAAPTGLGVTPGIGSNALSWNANSEADLASYGIYRGGIRIATVSAPTHSYTDYLLTSGQSYTYTITATDITGNESAHSSSQSGSPLYPPSAAPLTATNVPSVSWSSVSVDNGPAKYKVERSGDSGSTWTLLSSAQTATTYNDAALPTGQYEYRITTLDAVGNATQVPPIVIYTGTTGNSEHKRVLIGLDL